MRNYIYFTIVAFAMLVSCKQDTPFSLQPVTLQMKVHEMATIDVIGQNNTEWFSSNDSVATVFAGVVTANAIGKATITAKQGTQTATCEVFVTGTDGASLRISPSIVTLNAGETYQMQYGNTYELSMTWSSSDENIVSVSSTGLVTAQKPGNATITLKTDIEEVTALVAVNHKWGDYSLVWSDEFDGTTLDEDVWIIQKGGGGWGNNELQYYTDREENIRLNNGMLEIEARLEDYDNNHYTSARIMSKGKKTFCYGKMEARIKFPGGKGTWPAYWMMGNTGSWPACGEIDVIEHIGSQPTRASFAVHTPAKNGTKGNNWAKTHFFDESLADDFHVYGVEWAQEEKDGKDVIRFTVDGTQYAEIWEAVVGDRQSWPFDHPHFFIFNLAIGGSMGGTVDDAIFNEPRIMYVDWIRVYQREEIE